MRTTRNPRADSANVPLQEDPLGFFPEYLRHRDRRRSERAVALVELGPERQIHWDVEGVRQYLGRAPDGRRTCFLGVRVASPEARGPRDVGPDGVLPALRRAVTRQLESASNPAVALSGGLDSALVLALVRDRSTVPVFTLATGIPGYCELERTRASARELGVELEVIESSADELVELMPDTVRSAEVPFYNLHIVSKFVLARALAARGFDAVFTGDGADQVFAGADATNYNSIVGALFRHAGVHLVTPFNTSEVIAASRATSVDAQKSALRKAAAAILPADFAGAAKLARLTPPQDLGRYWDERRMRRLAHTLGIESVAPATPSNDADVTLWTTLMLLEAYVEREAP